MQQSKYPHIPFNVVCCDVEYSQGIYSTCLKTTGICNIVLNIRQPNSILSLQMNHSSVFDTTMGTTWIDIAKLLPYDRHIDQEPCFMVGME
ncbi:hypothetical protein TNCV_4589231 [Trichonephila clavipes]|nr:hypothetical protein TNCV_4589231 [Trichonephila clavipes]